MGVPFSLEGRVALVTGSSRGIGRATAIHLAEGGADIFVHYNKNLDLAETTAQTIRGLGRKAFVVGADLESPQAVDAMMDEVQEQTGSLDILVANAAATAFKKTQDIRPHHLDRTYNLVVKALVQMVQRAVPLMEGRDGRIITLSGHGTPFTLPNYAALGSAKAAVEAFTRYFAFELAPKGITANCVSPGVIDTDSARFYMGEEAYRHFGEEVARATPIGRMGTPEDVAAVVSFLASKESRFLTGQTLRVDGGISLTSAPFLT